MTGNPSLASDSSQNPCRSEQSGGSERFVIHISVDGLRPDAITALGPERLPNLYRLRDEGAWTDNARTVYASTSTLPNHVSQLSGYPVIGPQGHGWLTNSYFFWSGTLHGRRGAYLPSVFDRVHDCGLRTALYTGKGKFAVFERSYDAEHGAADLHGEDQGRNKLDVYVHDGDTGRLLDRFLGDMSLRPAHYSLLHLRDPDASGHISTWSLRDGSAYLRSVMRVDSYLGDILELIERSERLAGKTTVLLTADHGGGGASSASHSAAHKADNYTVPFYVWGPEVAPGELYRFNVGRRRDPGTAQTDDAPLLQPIRNADAANLLLGLLGLAAVKDSSINHAIPLRLQPQSWFESRPH